MKEWAFYLLRAGAQVAGLMLGGALLILAIGGIFA